MSIESFFNKISGIITNALNSSNIDQTSRVSNPFKGSVNASIFNGADINTFKNIVKNGTKINGNESIFYKNIDEAGIETVFDYFDKNGDGKIDESELKEISKNDGNNDDISGYDLNLALNNALDKKFMDDFDALIQAGLLNRDISNNMAIQNYTKNIGGSNYKNYGSRTHNGSTISTKEQFSTQQKLDNIEKTEIPELEKKKEQVIEETQQKIDAKNNDIEKEIKNNKDKLNELGEKYTDKQDEIKQCDTKISENKSKISESKSEIFKNESSLSKLSAELGALKTDTDSQEINQANTNRKQEIEKQISKLKEKINAEKNKIQEYQKIISEQEALKRTKQTELSKIQEEISKQNPKLSQTINKIREEINSLEQARDLKVQTIDKEISAKQEQAKTYQTEIGTKTGQASSMTGSKMVKNALLLAQQELDKGVYEYTGNNDSPEIDKYRNGISNGQPWCGSFVSWIYGAGQNSDNSASFGYDASVSGIMQKAQNAGYYEQIGAYTPKAGDLMIQKNGTSHVGMVTAVDPDGTIHTIEGNAGNRVSERVYSPGTSGYGKISGWVKMNEWLSA